LAHEAVLLADASTRGRRGLRLRHCASRATVLSRDSGVIDVEELLAERGLDVSYKKIRRWALKFGPA
jgi:transposase-like protein